MKAIFFHTDPQKQLAEGSLMAAQKSQKEKITTKILPMTEFYRAEDYHQKYMLGMDDRLMQVLSTLNLDPDQFTDSTVAARLNGFAGGHGTPESLLKQLEPLDLSTDFIDTLKPALEDGGK